MLLFIPRSLCALRRIAAKEQNSRFAATQGIRIALASGVYRAEATDGRRAMVVQGLIPGEDPPWPGFKDLPDDACETVILPRDLERACKVGEDFLQSRFGLFGIATMGNDVCLGLGSELVTCRTVEGRFPSIDQVIPKKRPLFTFSFDPKTLAETLLAMADLLPETDRRVQLFYYGDNLPIGFCARNIDNGIMIDALVVPLTKPDAKPEKDSEPVNGQDAEPDQPEMEAAAGAEEGKETAVQEPTVADAPPVIASGTARARRGVRRALEKGTPS
jgi:hypothetical protein